jgi:hypothetical protein
VVDKREISRKGAKPQSCRREEETNGRSQAVDQREEIGVSSITAGKNELTPIIPQAKMN